MVCESNGRMYDRGCVKTEKINVKRTLLGPVWTKTHVAFKVSAQYVEM
jgi:hypothetical protein